MQVFWSVLGRVFSTLRDCVSRPSWAQSSRDGSCGCWIGSYFAPSTSASPSCNFVSAWGFLLRRCLRKLLFRDWTAQCWLLLALSRPIFDCTCEGCLCFRTESWYFSDWRLFWVSASIQICWSTNSWSLGTESKALLSKTGPSFPDLGVETARIWGYAAVFSIWFWLCESPVLSFPAAAHTCPPDDW